MAFLVVPVFACVTQGCCWYSVFKCCGCIEDRKHVKVRFEGACTGCSVNQMTLKAGVETTIKRYAPQIETVENIA